MKILTHRSCIVSAKLLRDALSDLLGIQMLVTTNANRINGPFIRYGCTDAVKVKDTEYNSADFISLVSNKSLFSKLMKEKGIHSPVYYKNTKPTKYPVLIRKTLNSSGGRGIVVCPNEKTFEDNWSPEYVWTPFVKTQFELRVHILGGKIVKLFKKRFVGVDGQEEGEEQKEPNLPIRNLQRGYHYSARDIETYPKILDLLKQINPVLKGKFYTLDVGWDKESQKYFVFEANSGSGLNTQTVELYADYLAREFLS